MYAAYTGILRLPLAINQSSNIKIKAARLPLLHILSLINSVVDCIVFDKICSFHFYFL